MDNAPRIGLAEVKFTDDSAYSVAAEIAALEIDVTSQVCRVAAGNVHGWFAGDNVERIDILRNSEILRNAKLHNPVLPSSSSAEWQNKQVLRTSFEATLSGLILPLSTTLEFCVRAQLGDGSFCYASLKANLPIECATPFKFMPPIRVNLEQAELDDSHVLHVSGWAIAISQIITVEISADDEKIAIADPTRSREDVAAAYPSYTNPRLSGFAAAIRLSKHQAESLGTVRAKVIARDGSIKSMELPVVRLSSVIRRTPSPVGRPAPSQPPDKIFFNCDNIELSRNGRLVIEGWAVSPAGISRIAVCHDGQEIGETQAKLQRPDVGRLYSQISTASESGFRFSARLAAPAEGTHAITLRIETRDGHIDTVPLSVAASDVDIGETKFCFDVASVNSRGFINLSGWVVAEPAVVSITVDFDGIPLGYAKIGIPRPDVGNRFPKIASARNAGFQFLHDLALEVSGEHTLKLGILTGDGELQTIPLPIQAQIAEQIDFINHSAGEEIKFDIDTPVLVGDHARDAVRTTLTISGWAVATSGVASIKITIDDRDFGNAYYGMRREDVSSVFLGVDGSLLSGFALLVPARDLGHGEHAVRILIVSNNGRSAERSFSVMCEKSEDISASELIRSKIGQAEIDNGIAILDRLGHYFFSIYIRVSDRTEAEFFATCRTLASLRQQAYSNWRAVIIGLPKSDLSKMIDRLLISGELTAANLSISANLNFQSSNLCIGLLCAGDVLGSDALLEFAIHFALNPSCDFIYGDDRRYDLTSNGYLAFFKPDWSPDTLLSSNYIGRSWCARASLAESSGLKINTLSTIDPYDAVLRLTERAAEIGHISSILLEMADRRSDTASEIEALSKALKRRGSRASVGPGRAAGTFHVARRIVVPGRVSVVIPTIAARGLIETTICGLRDKTNWPDLEIICIDNIPPGENLYWKAWLRAHADKVIELAEPFNWSRFNNIGAAAATGDYFLFLNDDVEIIHPDWLEVMVSHAQRKEVGVVGPQLLYPDGKVQHAGIFLTAQGGRHAFRFADRNEPGPFGLALSERNVIAVTGACMLVRREAFHTAGGFNETHSVINNDVDYCLRAGRAGQLVVFTPYATLYHHELVSRAKLTDVYDETQFKTDWGPLLLKGDPYFNRRLSQDYDTWMPELEPIEAIYAGHPLIARRRVRRILAIKLDHIGDFITALPALRRIKQRFPEAELFVLCAKASKAMAALEPCINGVIEFNFFHARSGEGKRGITEEELLALSQALAPHRFDLAIDLRLQPDTRHVLKYTGAPYLAGFENDGLFPWLDIAVPWEGDTKLTPKRTHVSDRLTQLVETVSIACETERPALSGISVADARAHVEAMPALVDLRANIFDRAVVCAHPGVGSELRQWPASHFASLIDLLIGERDVRVVLIGAGEEEVVANSVLSQVTRREGVVSLVGKTTLQDLPFVLRACSLYVGNNSGPKHIAAALGVPTLGVHSAVVEAPEWGPMGPNAVALRRRAFCGPCYLEFSSQCPRNRACLSGLRPAEVYSMCLRLMGGAEERGLRSDDEPG